MSHSDQPIFVGTVLAGDGHPFVRVADISPSKGNLIDRPPAEAFHHYLQLPLLSTPVIRGRVMLVPTITYVIPNDVRDL